MNYYIWKTPSGEIGGWQQTNEYRPPPAISCTEEEFRELGFYQEITETPDPSLNPPEEPVTIESLQEENKKLNSKITALSAQQTMLEDCILELSDQVYT